VVVDSEFALADAADAQNKMLSSDFFGKIILQP
jgi:NADPH:quinone reductase-like Zn-dependent oxidoreductase